MRLNKKALLATMIAPALAFGTAQAAETGFYVGGNVGQSTIKADATLDDGVNIVQNYTFDKDETGWKGYVGFNLLPFLGVEAGYVDFGSPSGNQTFPVIGNVNAKVDATGWQAFVVGTVPVGPVDLFAKLGGIVPDFQLDARSSTARGSAKDDNALLGYGAGAQLNFGRLGFRLEAEGYDTDDLEDLYFISAGVTFHL